MPTNIKTVLFGLATGPAILKPTWFPSTGQYPLPNEEGNIRIAGDVGTVLGTPFVAGEAIIYYGGEWKKLGAVLDAADTINFKGDWDASTQAFPTASIGDVYEVSVTGSVGSPAISFLEGDAILKTATGWLHMTSPRTSGEIENTSTVVGTYIDDALNNIQLQLIVLDNTITDIQPLLYTISSPPQTLQVAVDALQTDVGTLQNDVSVMQPLLYTLASPTETVQTAVDALQTDVGNLQTDVNNIQPLLYTLASPTETVQVAVDVLQGDVATLQQDTAPVVQIYNDPDYWTDFTGSINPDVVTLSFGYNAPNPTFGITVTGDDYQYIIKGRKYALVPGSYQTSTTITDSTGLYFFYINTSQQIIVDAHPLDLDWLIDACPLAIGYWDAVANEWLIKGKELHGMIDKQTHKYLHETFGTQYNSGFNSTFTLVGDGSLAADAQIGLTGGTIRDEDLTHTIVHSASPSAEFEQILETTAQIPLYYRTGATGTWNKLAATTFPCHFGTSRLQYNQYTGSTWQLSDVPNNGNYVATWIVATNSITEPVIGIIGQRQDGSLQDAELNNTWPVLMGDFPTPEFKVLYRVIFQTSTMYTNAVKARIRSVSDYRTTISSPSATIAGQTHNALAGRDAIEAHPSDSIVNNSVVEGASVTDALNSLSDAMTYGGYMNENFTAEPNKFYLVNVNHLTSPVTGVTVTLPPGPGPFGSSPLIGWRIRLMDPLANWGTYNLTITAAGGATINGSYSPLVISTAGAWVEMVYTGSSTLGWATKVT